MTIIICWREKPDILLQVERFGLRKLKKRFVILLRLWNQPKALRCGLSSGVWPLWRHDTTVSVFLFFCFFNKKNFISNDRTNVDAPRRLDFEAVKHVCCIIIDRTAVRILQMEICAHFSIFTSVASVLIEQPYELCRWKYVHILIFSRLLHQYWKNSRTNSAGGNICTFSGFSARFGGLWSEVN